MTRVLIAADDSEESVTAARTARALFGDTADYTVVSVASTRGMLWAGSSMEWGFPYPMAIPPAGALGPPLVFQQPAAAADGSSDQSPDGYQSPTDVAEQQADEVAVAAHLPHPDAVGEMGDPVDAIIAASERCRADVIVVGSHDRNWLTKLFTKSVSNAVVRGATVPVLVVR